MKKRYLTFTLAVCLLIGILAGCAGGATTVAPTDTKATVAETTGKTPETSGQADVTTTTASGSELEMSDIPGMTAAGVLPIVTEPVTLTLGLPQSVGVMDYYDNYMTKLVKEETGIDMEFFLFPQDEIMDKFELMVAGNQELPDIPV